MMRERPVHFQWQILDWSLSPDRRSELGLQLQKGTIEAAEAPKQPQPAIAPSVTDRNMLDDRNYNILIDFEMAHAPIAQENMMRKAQAVTAAQPQISANGTAAPERSTSVPSAATQVRQVAANLP